MQNSWFEMLTRDVDFDFDFDFELGFLSHIYQLNTISALKKIQWLWSMTVINQNSLVHANLNSRYYVNIIFS